MKRVALAACAATAAVCATLARTRRLTRETAAWRTRAEEAEGALRLLVGAQTSDGVKPKRKGKRT